MWTIHAGHNPDGKSACGAIGYLKESTEARRVVDLLMESAPYYFENCTINDGKNQNDILKRLVKTMEDSGLTLNLSIHLNAGGGTGVECLVYDKLSDTAKIAADISKRISEQLGIKNRGVKERPDLYIIKHTTQPTIIVECAFVDSLTDAQNWDVEKVAYAILCAYAEAEGISGAVRPPEESSGNAVSYYRVQVGAYLMKSNADRTYTALSARGYDCFINREGCYYKLQIGAFKNFENAQKLAWQLVAEGYSAYITS